MAQYRLERLKCLSDPTYFKRKQKRIKKMEDNAFFLKIARYITVSVLAISLGLIGSCTYTSVHAENIDAAQLPLQIAKAKAEAESDKAKAQTAHSEEEIARSKAEISKSYFDTQREIEKSKAEASKAYFDSLPKPLVINPSK
jgi:hypothetical protein